jgi:hypothetical protein
MIMQIQPFLTDNQWVSGSGNPFDSTDPADGTALDLGTYFRNDVERTAKLIKAAIIKIE